MTVEGAPRLPDVADYAIRPAFSYGIAPVPLREISCTRVTHRQRPLESRAS